MTANRFVTTATMFFFSYRSTVWKRSLVFKPHLEHALSHALMFSIFKNGILPVLILGHTPAWMLFAALHCAVCSSIQKQKQTTKKNQTARCTNQQRAVVERVTKIACKSALPDRFNNVHICSRTHARTHAREQVPHNEPVIFTPLFCEMYCEQQRKKQTETQLRSTLCPCAVGASSTVRTRAARGALDRRTSVASFTSAGSSFDAFFCANSASAVAHKVRKTASFA